MNNGLNKTLRKIFQKVVPAKIDWNRIETMIHQLGGQIKMDENHKHAWVTLNNGERGYFPVNHFHFLEGRGHVVKFKKFLDHNGITPEPA